MTATTVAGIITGGITDLGTGLGLIFAGVIVLVVGVFLFKKGLAWVKKSGS